MRARALGWQHNLALWFELLLACACCEGYPPASPSGLQLKAYDAINFYIPSSHRCGVHSCTICDDTKPESAERELACTLVRHRTPSELSFRGKNDSTMTTEDAASTIDRNRPVVVLCHGLLSWRNDRLLARLSTRLATELHCHAVRFDFGGNGQSSGPWRYGGYSGELCDLRRVLDCVQTALGCRVSCILGHSKGSASVLQYAWERERGQENKEGGVFGDALRASSPCVVNLAGRFTVPNNFDPTSRFTEDQLDELAKCGKFVAFSRGGRRFEVTQQDVDERRMHDMSFVRTIESTPVLTIHGDADQDVDVENARRFDAVIPRHELHIINGADHNFKGLKHMDELVSTIASFLRTHIVHEKSGF